MVRKIQLTQGKVAVVDDKDFDLVSRYSWIAHENRNVCYAATYLQKDNVRSTVYMHRLIMDALPGITVDHIDRDGLNNTRGNLRLATVTQQLANTGLRPDNTTGFKGVYLDKRWNRYYSHIQFRNKVINLGFFKSAEEAAHAYDQAARELFGEFASTNFPIGIEPIQSVLQRIVKHLGVVGETKQ